MSDIPGMSEGIEAVRVIFQGVELLLRTSTDMAKWSFENLVSFSSFLMRVHKTKKNELKPGEIQFSDLSKKGETSLFQVKYSDKDNIVEYLNKAGVTYSIMPDLNRDDEYFEIAYLSSQEVAIKNYIAKNPDKAKTYTFAEYKENVDNDMVEKVLESLGNDAKADAIVNETIKDDYGSILKNNGSSVEVKTSLMDFSNLYNSDMLKIAVPNEKDMYIEVNKQRLFKTDEDNKKFLNVAFKQDEMFVLVNSKGEKLLDEAGNERYITSTQFNESIKHMKNVKSQDKVIYFSNIDKNGVKTTLTKTANKNKTPSINMDVKPKIKPKSKSL